ARGPSSPWASADERGDLRGECGGRRALQAHSGRDAVLRSGFPAPHTEVCLPMSSMSHSRRAVAVPARSVFALALAGLLLPLAAASPSAHPRPQEPLDGGAIAHELHRLQTVGSALFVAAHPDDENTALLAWLTHVKGVRTAYLSMTRGDGGQNLL